MTKTLTIINEKGLHARASAKFVEMVENFDADAEVSKDGMTVAGNSIMGLMMLAASKGSTIDVTTSGEQAEALADALEMLVGDYFGEGQ
ncbi:HPr family phosphocarrier protein [Amylibacter sp. SFDW26]|uniref:HPr family phosphocarrier protein n=1 Tax=Amylibacter sp. SFDW26 TaxID=2652722 RepID=UPI001261579F|nr:HPr family phosphocarrier protein [Amylibacter sp. SFDW26]KAB7614821.1 HPr family phosphocarrier protein [Amylibacter sp. SFDW26]